MLWPYNFCSLAWCGRMPTVCQTTGVHAGHTAWEVSTSTTIEEVQCSSTSGPLVLGVNPKVQSIRFLRGGSQVMLEQERLTVASARSAEVPATPSMQLSQDSWYWGCELTIP